MGKSLHALFIRNFVEFGVFHFNTLIGMYSRLGFSSYALRVFDEMPDRNSASWNAAVSCCVRSGLFREAAELFREMGSLGLPASGFVVAGILSACSQFLELSGEGPKIHGFVRKVGLMSDVFVGTSLLHLYGSCGLIEEVNRLFPDILEKNVVSWTALIASFSKNGHPERAMRAFYQMRKGGTVANENCFATAVSACAALENVRLSLEIFSQVIICGLDSSISVGNSLITMFGRLGKTEDALFIFNRMRNRDRISWNSIISVFSQESFIEEAVEMFRKMRYGEIKPDSTTLGSLISSFQSTRFLNCGRALHSLVLKEGFIELIIVCNALISMYSLCSNHYDAEQMFDEMPHRDLISWNCLMASYLSSGNNQETLNLLSRMMIEKMEVNHVTLTASLSACSSPDHFKTGKSIHAISALVGFRENVLVGNSLITMYSKCSSIEDALQVFKALPDADVISWNSLIGGFVEKDQVKEAIKYFNSMRRSCLRPNHITMTNLLGACSLCTSLHGLIISSGFDSDVSVKNSLLTAYSKCGDLNSSLVAFNELEVKTLVSYNAMIFGKAHNGLGEEALKMFLHLCRGDLIVDEFTFSAAMGACSSLAMLQEGQQLHGLMLKHGHDSSIHGINSSMDMYAKCGKMNDALKLFSATKKHKICSQTWNILISAYARYGQYNEARSAFQAMIKSGKKPDHVTFVSLLSACSHAGLVDEGLSLFSTMATEFQVPHSIEHCVCVMDLLGRAGRITEAELFVEKMPVEPNDLIWRSLLSSCRIYGELFVGKKAAERLRETDPRDDSAYVLLSNVYALNNKWGDVERVRASMELMGMRKKPGYSWVRIKNMVSSFGSGEGAMNHSRALEIRAKMEEILCLVRGLGYVADTRFVYHDLDEEEKENSLWVHSEKVALAFGLVAAPPGTALTVYKNLRVCGDCHTVFKLVSGVLEREIVLRDCYRFHHFAGGACSCSDYW